MPLPPPLPDPIARIKSEMAELVVQRTLRGTQEMAAAFLRIDQPRMSNLRRGVLDRFSLEQLLRFITRAGGEIQITVTWTRGRWIFGDPP
jgi:predicted XRE-type DNA-binding protein